MSATGTKVRVTCVMAPLQASGAASEEADEIGQLLPLDDDPAKMGWLSVRGWLAQDTHMRGSYVISEGLARRGHPELMMLNVPSGFIQAAIDLVTRLSRRVSEGIELGHGQVVRLVDDGPPASLAVLAVPAAEGEGLGEDALRLVPLL